MQADKRGEGRAFRLEMLKLSSDQTDTLSIDLRQRRLNGDGRLLAFGHTRGRSRSLEIKSRPSRIQRHRRQPAHEPPLGPIFDS